jgi:hypothetical protein
MYSSQNIIRHIKARRMRWAGRVARMVKEKTVYRILWESLNERDH